MVYTTVSFFMLISFNGREIFKRMRGITMKHWVMGTMTAAALLLGSQVVHADDLDANQFTKQEQMLRSRSVSFDWGKVDWTQHFATVMNKNYKIYNNFNDWKTVATTAKYYHKTLRITAKYPLNNGKSYYAISDQQGQPIGYINVKGLKAVDTEWGSKIPYKGYYATITKGGQSIWSNLNWGWKANSEQYLNKTFKIDGYYNKVNGEDYWSLYSPKSWLGYLVSNVTEKNKSPFGKAFSANFNVTIDRKNYDIYKDKEFHKKASSSSYYNKRFKVKTTYNHYNGRRYYSLYDSRNKWFGYINADATDKTNGSVNGNGGSPAPSVPSNPVQPDPTPTPTPDPTPQPPAVKPSWGKIHNYKRYATIMSKNYDLYSNKKWKKAGKTSKYYHKTIKVNGYYRHTNGNKYYSLYTTKNKWIGYVNSKSLETATSSWGAKINNGKYTAVKSTGYDIYKNKDWKKGRKTKSYKDRTLKIDGYYAHANGNKYYSIRSNNGWIGYVNSKAMNTYKTAYGKKYNYKRYFTVKNNNYTRYGNQYGKEVGKTSNYYLQTIRVNGMYKAYNGETYYSLYSRYNNWVGYTNRKAGSATKSPWGVKLSRSQNLNISSKNYKIYKNQDWKYGGKTSKYYRKRVKINGYYSHYNGSQYESVSTTKKKWIGYVNAKATSNNVISSNGVYQFAMDIAHDVVNKFGGVITSGYRPGSRNELGQLDDHSQRCAIDISGVSYNTYQKMKTYVVNKYKNAGLKYVIANNTWATHLGGWQWSTYPYGAHLDHIHISVYPPK